MFFFKKQVENLHRVRLYEFEEVVHFFQDNAPQSRVLEIGSGTGFQLGLLKKHFRQAEGIEIAGSNYRKVRDVGITEYDGLHIPFEDNSFEVVFSSNTLEHVVDLTAFENEIKRVLTVNGICIHIIPSHTWKWWSILFHYPMLLKTVQTFFERKKNDPLLQQTGRLSVRKKSIFGLLFNVVFPPLHGERGNRFSEIYYLHPCWWKKHFDSNGWQVLTCAPTGVYYSGYFIATGANRKLLSKWMGSSCYIYVLSKA